ncbi:hypothetical protein ETI06_08880 [Macrococcoides goetzii]|nr:hypothetical protein [Macrococcus goetzii]TDM42446.1 hypothetical protein ETI10_04955 [Macrococcus goetzii]TDM47569.1 hypothetical protein ETI08_00065 [Macrococcus goetzii]TDM49125.1 hypothetical protein ETI06_08880 [Macrococcus goetzii]
MKERMRELEEQIDQHSRNRTLNSIDAIKLLDEYYEGLLNLMRTLNDLEPNVELKADSIQIGPLNFIERIKYIEQRKHHFMGYQQMKTMLVEINKLIAIKSIKKKR